MAARKSISFKWAGEKLVLMPERAIWWSRKKTLFIADTHFGKASTFRHAGIPVPETSHHDDLTRLSEVLRRTRAKKLVILGDFFHAKTGRSPAAMTALKEWRERRNSLEIILVRGNHDSHAGPPPVEWSFQCVDGPLPLPPFICSHHPLDGADGFVLAGHLHPSFYFEDHAGSGTRFPCFHFSGRNAVLPAFGNFTGTHAIKSGAEDRVFVITGNEVIDTSAIVRHRHKTR